MEIAVLGELRVREGDLDRTPRGQRSRDLLAVLLMRRGQAVEPSTLLDLVWGQEAAALSAAVVHTQVARLRRALGENVVETTDTGYRLGDASTDAEEFLRGVDQARAIRDPAAALVCLDQALARWRGTEAYADVSSAIVEPEVVRLDEARTDALELRADLLLRTGALHDALTQAEALITLKPLRERGHELAMLATWRLGRQAEALAGYDRVRRLLRDELGVDPGPAVRDLHGRMLDHDPSLDDSGPAPPITKTAAPPRPTTATVGRDAELDQLRKLVAERPLVTITGPGGVGKSRLLAELHAAVGATRPTVFIDLATFGDLDAERVAEALAQVLAVSVGAEPPLDVVRQALADADTLVMIDEAERNTAAVGEVVATIARDCPQVVVVVASRRPLDVVGEALVPVAPLVCPPYDADDRTIADAAAVRLLRDRLADHAPDLELDARLDLLAALARRVDGLPLALELIAGHARTASLADLEQLLEDPLDLASIEGDRPDRHRTLRDVVTWSYERLSAAEAAALRGLAVFAGPFCTSVATAVVGGDPGLLRSLTREGLVHVERSGDAFAFRLLRTVRDLALGQLEQRPEDYVEVRRRHRRWHADRWRDQPRSDALLFDVRDHYSDFVAALADALDTQDADAIEALTITLCRLWSYTDMIRTGLRWSDRAVDSGLLGAAAVARIQTMQSTLLLHHDPARVRTSLAPAIDVLEKDGDARWLVTAHLVAGLERSTSGDFEAALDHGRQAVRHARRTTPERQADALGALAVAAMVTEPQEAEQAAREAWALALRSGSAAAISSVAANVSWALIGLGQAQDARDVLDQTLAERTRIVSDIATLQDPDAIPTFLRLNLAWAALLTGAPEAALAGFAAVLQAGLMEVESRSVAEVLLGAGVALADLGADDAGEVLAGAVVLADRTELALLPWQEKVFAQAVERTGGRDRWSWGSDLVTGHRLARLVVAAAVSGAP